MVPVCSPRHRLARVPRVGAAALAGERWVAFPPRPRPGGEPYALALERGLSILGLHESEIVPIDSLTAQKRMVEAGFGLALLPASSVDEELRAGTLSSLRVPALRLTVPIVLIHRRRAYLSGAAQALAAMLTDWPTSTPVEPGPVRRRTGRPSSFVCDPQIEA